MMWLQLSAMVTMIGLMNASAQADGVAVTAEVSYDGSGFIAQSDSSGVDARVLHTAMRPSWLAPTPDRAETKHVAQLTFLQITIGPVRRSPCGPAHEVCLAPAVGVGLVFAGL